MAKLSGAERDISEVMPSWEKVFLEYHLRQVFVITLVSAMSHHYESGEARNTKGKSTGSLEASSFKRSLSSIARKCIMSLFQEPLTYVLIWLDTKGTHSTLAVTAFRSVSRLWTLPSNAQKKEQLHVKSEGCIDICKWGVIEAGETRNPKHEIWNMWRKPS